MTFEQTTAYRTNVQNAVRLCKEYRYMVNGNQALKDYENQVINIFGVSAATKILKKANQVLKYKAYLQA